MKQTDDLQVPQEGLQYIHAWHYDMLANQERSEYYDRLIRENCRDKVVFEIGTGSGLLSVLAVRHGAKKVICCEENPLLAMAAKQLFRRMNVEDKVQLISKKSHDIKTEELPPVDVVLHELFGSDPFDEEFISTLKDARRFMAPNAIFLPEKIQLIYKTIGQAPLNHKLYYQDIELFEMSALLSQVHPNLRSDKGLSEKVYHLPEVTIQEFLQKPYVYEEVNPELQGVDALLVTYLIKHHGQVLQAAEFSPAPGRIHWFPLSFIKLDVNADKIVFSVKDEKQLTVL